MPSWLYRVEAKGIQSWILSSRRLKDMTGGSEIIENLLGDLPGGAAVISRAAGAATLRFDHDADLASWVRRLPRDISRRAPGLHVVQAAVPENGTFEQAHRALREALGEERQRVPTALPVPGPFVHRAGETGRAAVARDSGKNGDLLDAAMQRKRNAGEQSELAGGSKFGRRFFPEEFHDRKLLDEDQWPEGPIAVIHADGNRMGEYLLGLEREDDYRRFSEQLTAITHAAVHAALRATFKASDRGELPCRPVVLGGDDVTVLLPAHLAFAFTETFLSAFADGKLQGKPISASAGVACVRNGYPFSQAYKLAEDLCKLAKNDKAPRGAIAFARVTTARADGYRRRVTAYALEEMQRLHRLAGTAKQLPRGKLREWLPLVETDPRRAEAFWQRFRAASGESAKYKSAVDALAADMESTDTATRKRLIFSALELNQILGRGERAEEGA
jgi:hypothetical protein